jgi:hypothetical protein
MKPSLKYGLLLAAAVILLHLVIHFTVGADSQVGKSVMLLNYGLYTLAIVLCLLELRKEQQGYLTYGKAFSTGFMVMLSAGLIVAIYTYVYYKFINHDFIVKSYALVQQSLDEKNLDENSMATANKVAHIMLTPGGISVITLLGMLFWGAIISLIIAAFLKRDQGFPGATPVQEAGFDPYR